ncbi:MAG TPA: hypothetical protein VLA29_09475 [Acidimicrobiia bacterium]|nr:hypothetical protein [Acidimicrobiia bacterium]
MLRWSAENTNRSVDLKAIADPAIDAGLVGALPLVGMARAALRDAPDPGSAIALADSLGEEAAVDAVAVAAAFELFNRVVDGTGLPVGAASRRNQADIIRDLGIDRFPHADVGRADAKA